MLSIDLSPVSVIRQHHILFLWCFGLRLLAPLRLLTCVIISKFHTFPSQLLFQIVLDFPLVIMVCVANRQRPKHDTNKRQFQLNWSFECPDFDFGFSNKLLMGLSPAGVYDSINQ